MKRTLFLLGCILMNLKSTSSELSKNININGSIITAPNAGIILLHKGQYRPSNQVVHNTAMFPMTAATCYLLPIGAARKIPTCNNFTSHIMHKRFLADIISIAASTAALGASTASIILTKNLEKKVNQLQTSMETMSNYIQVGEARMAQFETNQIRLGTSLQQSQQLLNTTINQVNQHSLLLETHENRLNEQQRHLLNLQRQLLDNEQAVVNRFLYLATQDIIDDKATLAFLHPSDIYLVVEGILQASNITISNAAEQLPIATLITKLIIRQQIDFIPAERYSTKLAS
jgi:hypothetical protein